MKNKNQVECSQWVTRLHNNGGKIDSFSHLCPECKYECRDLNVNGKSTCPCCGVEMIGDVHE
jgi:predicted Zn-ribbon and HTH transcriptional regulator